MKSLMSDLIVYLIDNFKRNYSKADFSADKISTGTRYSGKKRSE